jgi:predicted ATPase
MERFVLTGGHGVGKSSLIAALELRGEHVVHEAAATIRSLGRANGDPFPEETPDFESCVLALHLLRESRVPPSAQRVFLDRGAPDHLAYARAGRWPLSGSEIASCRDAHYALAFMVEPPASGVPTIGRAEADFCRRLVAMIEEVYAESGIPVIKLPYMPVDDRVALILHTVRDRTATQTVPESSAGTKPT